MLSIIKEHVSEYHQQSLELMSKLPVMDIIPAFAVIRDDLAMEIFSTRITSLQVARYYFGDVITDNQIKLATELDDKYAKTFISLVKTKVYPQTIAIMSLRGWPYTTQMLNKVLP